MLTSTPLFRMPSADEVARHMPIVRRVVARFLRRVPPNVLRDDLMAAGVVGLIDSLRKNGGDEGPVFETYARIRIRGAILDELRAQDWLPRRVRRAIEKDGEGGACVVGIEDLDPSDRAAVDDSKGDSAETMLIASRESARMERAIEQLPERERLILKMHYFQDVRFKDIGAVLGVSEPRVSQLHSRALGQLRKVLELQMLAEAA
jgi:RNA polymerase sigma factor for flagellar operon FliA